MFLFHVSGQVYRSGFGKPPYSPSKRFRSPSFLVNIVNNSCLKQEENTKNSFRQVDNKIGR